jgi:hypothetical protein
MSIKLGLSIGLSVLLIVPPVAAADSTKPAKVKKVCRSEMETGSRVPRSQCLTQEQWDEVDAANAEAARRFTNKITQNGGLNSGGGSGGAGPR